MNKEELKKKTKCELIQMILEFKPPVQLYKLWVAKKSQLIKYYIKLKNKKEGR